MAKSAYKKGQELIFKNDERVGGHLSGRAHRYYLARIDKGWDLDEEGNHYINRRLNTYLVYRTKNVPGYLAQCEDDLTVVHADDVTTLEEYEKSRMRDEAGSRRLQREIDKLRAEAGVAERKIQEQAEELAKLRALESVFRQRQPNLYAEYKAGVHPMVVDHKGTRFHISKEVLAD